MARFGLLAAPRTKGRLPAVHRNRPRLLAPFDAHDVSSSPRVTQYSMFSSPLLPHSVVRRQTASASLWSAAPGLACTKSQSDPLEMRNRSRALRKAI